VRRSTGLGRRLCGAWSYVHHCAPCLAEDPRAGQSPLVACFKPMRLCHISVGESSSQLNDIRRAMWHYSETGSGRPLVLLHGIGMSSSAWSSVTPYLSATRRVVAFDIAGFGRTPSLPRTTPPTSASLAAALEESVRAMDLEVPVDIAGNSLGGLIALEAAKRGLARTVVAISPPGLWRDHGAAHVKYLFASLRFLATKTPSLLKAAMRTRVLRELALAIPISVGSGRMPVSAAIGAIDDLAAASGFEDTFLWTATPFSGRDITVPLTVVFGDCDFILPKGCRRRDELPPHTRWITKRGWGHVPMWIDPVGVSQLILEGTRDLADIEPATGCTSG
jgi:pimeloyl-ACP methyl ester carboxylesterase